MRVRIGDLVAFVHRRNDEFVECTGTVVEFTVNAPDAELVIRTQADIGVPFVFKDRSEVRPAAGADR